MKPAGAFNHESNSIHCVTPRGDGSGRVASPNYQSSLFLARQLGAIDVARDVQSAQEETLAHAPDQHRFTCVAVYICHKFCLTLRASIMRLAVLKVSATDGKESNMVVLLEE
jgi:hypothetical protein